MRMLGDSSPTVVDASTVPLLVTPASASPAAGSSNANFDANMVVILAALLCVLICALGLNSLIRCALHGGRTLAAPPAAAVVIAAAPATDAGLKKQALRRIPVQVFESKTGVPGTDCAICLGEFADGEKVRVLPGCHHGFHVRCIDMWLAAHSSCPICRNSLLEEGGAGEATVASAGDGT